MRPLSGEVPLEVACEMIADLRDFRAEAVRKIVARGPLLFFPHARQNGDGSWRVPARDVRALLGGGMPIWDQAVSARTFAEWCEVHPRTVVRAINRGELRKVVCFGEWRIPVGEFARLMAGGAMLPGGAARSFFSSRPERGVKR